MAHDEPDPNIPEDDRHPGAPPKKEKRRIGEDRRAGEEKPLEPVGNSAEPDEPAAFPPHN